MKVALREYWPGVVSGEKESLERLSTALKIIGIEPVKVPVSLDDEEVISKLNPLFVLDLHFDAPRIQSAFSVGALWNPLDYYELWGGTAPWSNQLQHDLLVAANPEIANGWLNLYKPQSKFEILQLNHSVPSSAVRESGESIQGKVFYAGIGWDRGASGGHRHEEIFRALDELNLLKLFGPEKLGDGTKPWKGFKSYSGQLPFDGDSVMKTINDMGFGLCFSSSSHTASQIASNRVFETIAAGSIPIVDQELDFPFSIADAIRVSSLDSPQEIAIKVQGQVARLAGDPEEFRRRVGVLQKNLMGGFTLDQQLAKISQEVQNRKAIQISNNDVKVINAIQVASDSETSWKGGLDSLETNPVKLSLNLNRKRKIFEENPNAWVVFSMKSFDPQLFANQLALFNLENVDVLHLHGTAVVKKKKIFLPVETARGFSRNIESFCVRAKIVADWLLDSAGCASIGALLSALAEDAKHGEQGHLTHLQPKLPAYNLGTSEEVHVSDLTSKLDDLTLISLANQKISHTSMLASIALSERKNLNSLAFGGGVLDSLAMEVSRLGLKTLLRQGLNFLRRQLSK